MNLPFTYEEFVGVFAEYNLALWPGQMVAYLLGLIAVVLAVWPMRLSGRLISVVLAAFWLLVGVVYHLTYFRAINPAAALFGAVFILQGLLFLVAGVFAGRLDFHAPRGAGGIIGGLLILYALVIYPLLGYLLGHRYPESPVFGVAPCPLVIFTLGLLLWTVRRAPWYLLVIPALWAVVGTSAALHLGMQEDLGLPTAALLAIIVTTVRKRTPAEPTPPTSAGAAAPPAATA